MNPIRFAAGSLLLLCAIVAVAALCGGCGKGSQSAITPTSLTSAATSIANVSRSKPEENVVPEFDRGMAFSDLVPNSKVVETIGAARHYRFTYKNATGETRICDLPEPMTQGRWMRDTWLTVFGLYNVSPAGPKVVANAPRENLDDFPFISPRNAESQ